MPSTKCECGFDIVGEDRDSQVAAAVEHFNTVHPEYGVTATQCRNYLERAEQLSPDAARREQIGPIDIVPISAERVDDILAFFDHDAFADNAGWASCYCMAHHAPAHEGTPEWGTRTWQQNRDDIAARVQAGETTGVLAYEGGKLVAWCNASPRCRYPDYAKGDEADNTTGVVACFVVAPTHRGHGIAPQLLSRALERLQDDGMDAVEAYPAADPQSPAASYRGTPDLYRQAGFEGPEGEGRTVTFRRRLG